MWELWSEVGSELAQLCSIRHQESDTILPLPTAFQPIRVINLHHHVPKELKQANAPEVQKMKRTRAKRKAKYRELISRARRVSKSEHIDRRGSICGHSCAGGPEIAIGCQDLIMQVICMKATRAFPSVRRSYHTLLVADLKSLRATVANEFLRLQCFTIFLCGVVRCGFLVVENIHTIFLLVVGLRGEILMMAVQRILGLRRLGNWNAVETRWAGGLESSARQQ